MGWLIMSVLKEIPNLWAYKLIKLEAYFEWFEATTYQDGLPMPTQKTHFFPSFRLMFYDPGWAQGSDQ